MIGYWGFIVVLCDFMGFTRKKTSIYMASFHSYVTNHQRVDWLRNHETPNLGCSMNVTQLTFLLIICYGRDGPISGYTGENHFIKLDQKTIHCQTKTKTHKIGMLQTPAFMLDWPKT